jgi:hypothetical protein
MGEARSGSVVILTVGGWCVGSSSVLNLIVGGWVF